MDENFTPKQIAMALRVSESSVKRWCDRGVIRTDRTLGGHRRIPLEFLLQFLEATNRRIVDPSAIGLEPQPEVLSAAESDDSSIQALFEKSLLDGNEEQCRKAIGAWYTMHGSIASVADKLVAPAFRSIGELWQCGKVEIYQERRGCELCNRLMQELRRLLPEPAAFSPLAMGGTCSGDDYQLPTQLIEMVFRESGWRTISLGCGIPLSSMLSAARKHMPRIFWLSVSHIPDQESFLQEYHRFASNLPKGISLVVGGRALTDDIRPQMTYAAYCDTLQQLATLATSLRIGVQSNGPQIQISGAKTAIH